MVVVMVVVGYTEVVVSKVAVREGELVKKWW